MEVKVSLVTQWASPLLGQGCMVTISGGEENPEHWVGCSLCPVSSLSISEFLALRMVSEDQECAGWLEVFYHLVLIPGSCETKSSWEWSQYPLPSSPGVRHFSNIYPSHQVDPFTYSILKSPTTTWPHLSEFFSVSHAWTNFLSWPNT